MNEPLLSIKGLTVEFRIHRGILRAVDNVDLDIHEGEILGLVGESGSGKSVLAHAIIKQVDVNGYIKDGRILFKGKGDIMALKGEKLRRLRWKDIAIVFQGALNSLNPVMKIEEQMMDTVLAHERPSREEMHGRFSNYLKFVRLDPDRTLKLYPYQNSGGMKQRILVAMGLLLTPKLLILDEPTSSLDVLTQKYFITNLKDLHKESGLTMLFITHELAMIGEIAERLAIIYLGSIFEVGGVDDIFYDPKHPYTIALIRATPSIVGEIGCIKPMPGPVPDPMSPPPACKFHPRCPFAIDICRNVRPELENIGGGRLVACHRWKETSELSKTEGS